MCHQHDYLQNILIRRREIERKFNFNQKKKFQFKKKNKYFLQIIFFPVSSLSLSTQKRIKKDIFFESNFQSCVLKIPANSSIDPSCALNCALSALKTDTLHSFHVISSVKISFGRNRSRERNFLERIARELFKKRDGRWIAFFAFFDVDRWRLKKKEFFLAPYFLRVPPRKKLVNEEPPSTRFNGVWISDR